jgi:hypothetical protein
MAKAKMTWIAGKFCDFTEMCKEGRRRSRLATSRKE